MDSPKINLENDFFYYDENGRKILIDYDYNDNDDDYNDDDYNNDDSSIEENEYISNNHNSFLLHLWDAIENFLELF